MPVIRDPSPRKITVRPAPRGAGGSVFKQQTPEQELGVVPKTTHAPDRAPYRHGQAPEQKTTTQLNRVRAASPVPRNPVDPRVVQIQQHLVALGYNVAVDGVMGPLTQAAMSASNNGTTPNHVYHPDHAKVQARQYNRRVRAELRNASPRGRAAIVKTQFAEPAPLREDPIVRRPPISLRAAPRGGKPIFYHPMFDGQQPAGETGAMRGPDGTVYFPGQRAPKGSRVTTVPYYQADAAGEQGLQSILGGTDNQDALRKFKFEQEGGIGGAILAGALHPAVDLLQAAAGERSITPGGTASDIGQIATLGLPVAGATERIAGTLGDVMQAVRTEGLSSDALRSIRDLHAFSKQTALAAMRSGRMARADAAVSNLTINSPQRDALIQSFKDAPRVTRPQVKAATRLIDKIARNLARSEGITPEEAYSRMISGSKYHDLDPTASEAKRVAQSDTFQRSDLTRSPIWDHPEKLRERALEHFDVQQVPFISKLHELVGAMPPKVGVQELLGKIKSAGIKQDEVRWNRFDEFLASVTQKGQKSITRDEALAWLDENYLKLEENKRFMPGGGYGQRSLNDDETIFGSYTLPGGQQANYQEFTIRLPADEYGHLYEYTSHFPDPNIVAHVRATDRPIGEDNALMIEEIQSDWHQAGQKQGYKIPVTAHPDYPMRQQAVENAASEVDAMTSTLRKNISDAIIKHPLFENIPGNLAQAFERNAETRLGINLTDGNSIRDFEDKASLAARARVSGNRAEVTYREDAYGHPGYQAHIQLDGVDRNLGMFRNAGYDDPGTAEKVAQQSANAFNLLLDMPEQEFKSVWDGATELRRSLYNLQEKRQLMRALEHDASRGVHEAPFAKTWHELAFKRMLAEAVDKGYDRVAWTTGRTQAERYDLGNFFQRIEIRNESSSNGYGNDALEQWARDRAESYADIMNAEDLGWSDSEEERVRQQAEEYVSPVSEDDFTTQDPETGEDVFDERGYYEAVDERDQEVEAEYERLAENWLDNARDSYQSSEYDYYMENSHEFDDAPSSSELTVYATDHNGQVHTQDASTDQYQGDPLENVVGPDVARAYFQDGTSVFEGDNLVMGENAKSALGASHFYDNKLTGFVNKYLKKFGVKVEKSKLGKGDRTFDYRIDYLRGGFREGDGVWGLEMPNGHRAEFNNYWDAINAQHDRTKDIPRVTILKIKNGDIQPDFLDPDKEGIWVKWSDFPESARRAPEVQGSNQGPYYEDWGGSTWGPFDDEVEARQFVENTLISKMNNWGISEQAAGTEVHSIPINDEVRKFVEGGQPLFQRDKLAKEVRQLTGPRVKGAVDLGGDSGSVVHLFRRADISTIIHEVGHILQQYTPELHKLDQEEFARTFERYFAEGKSPTPEMRKPFKTVAEGMLRVYGRVDAIPGANINPSVARVFDRFFTREARLDPEWGARTASTWLGQHEDFHEAAGKELEAHAALARDIAKTLPESEWPAWVKNQIREQAVGPNEPVKWPEEQAPDTLPSDWNMQQDPVDPALEAAAMQVKQGGSSPEDAAKMLNVDLDTLKAHLSGGGHEAEQARILSNADVGSGEAATTEDASTILNRAQIERRGMNDYRVKGERPGSTLGFESHAKAEKYLNDRAQRKEYLKDWNLQEEGGDWSDDPSTPADDNLATPYEALSPEEKLQRGFRRAREARKAQDLGYSEERRARFARAEEIMQDESLDPLERHWKAKEELRDELPKIEFEGFKELDNAALSSMVRHLQSHPNLSTGQRTRAVDALLEGVDGKTPQPSQILLLEHVFGKMTTRGIVQVAKHPYRELLLDALNVPRSLMATLDFSAPFRQGLVAGARHPRMFARNFGPMLRAAKSETYYNSVEQEIHNHPLYPMALDGGLALTDFESQATREEQYFSNMAERYTGGKYSPVRASGRAYVTFLNKMRFDMFKYHLSAAHARNVDVHNEEFLHHLSEFINSATGRGGGGERFERSASALNTFLFSPRLLKSRLNFLNPFWYAKMDKYTRVQAVRSSVTLAAEITAFLSTLALAVPGVKVVTDPRNPDWGKVKLGNTRIDIAGGFQQPIRLFAQVATGTAISSTTGKKLSLTSGGFGDPTKLDIILRFFEGKESPIASFVTDYLRNSDQVGNKFEIKREVAQRVIPLLAQDTYDLYKNGSGGMDGIALAAGAYGLGAFGFGMQTYGPKDPAKAKTTKLQDEAKKAGLGTVPKQILVALDHKAHLDSITASNKGKPMDALRDAVDYYGKTTKDNGFSAPYRLVKAQGTDEDARTLLHAIREAMIGPGLSQYESAVQKSVEAQQRAAKK